MTRPLTIGLCVASLAANAILFCNMWRYRAQRNQLRVEAAKAASPSAVFPVIAVNGIGEARGLPPRTPRRRDNPDGFPRVLLAAMNMHLVPAESEAPTSANLAIDQEEDQEHLRRVLARVFPNGHEGISAEQKTIELLKFVTSFVRWKDNSGSATKILQDGYAICGGHGSAFQILARMVGVPTRYTGIFGLQGGSHAVCEVFYDGRWHLTDPSYGVFFYSEAKYDGSGRVLSLRELLECPEKGNCFHVVPTPSTGNYTKTEREFPVTKYSADSWHHPTKIGELYRRWFREAYPVWYDYHGTISFPICLDLDREGPIAVGQADQDYQDVVTATAASRFKGTFFMSQNCIHTLCLSAARPAIVEIQYQFLGEQAPPIEVASLKSFVLMKTSSQGGTVTITALIKDGRGIASVCIRGNSRRIDCYRIRKLSDAPGFGDVE